MARSATEGFVLEGFEHDGPLVRVGMTKSEGELARGARRDRATSFYSVGSENPDHDAVIRIGSEAPKRRAHSG